MRRTLAFSIHELAVILGPKLTQSDLVPIFDGFIKDLDEVRVGVLSHFADFIKVMETLSVINGLTVARVLHQKCDDIFIIK